MNSEYDLHIAVVSYIRAYYPQVIIIAGLGEMQTTPYRRLDAYKKGYTKGQPDLILLFFNKYYNGLCIELKTPKGTGRLSDAQKDILQRLSDSGFKCIVSNNYEEIIQIIDEYMLDSRIRCQYCFNGFINNESLQNHITYFHRI